MKTFWMIQGLNEAINGQCDESWLWGYINTNQDDLINNRTIIGTNNLTINYSIELSLSETGDITFTLEDEFLEEITEFKAPMNFDEAIQAYKNALRQLNSKVGHLSAIAS